MTDRTTFGQQRSGPTVLSATELLKTQRPMRVFGAAVQTGSMVNVEPEERVLARLRGICATFDGADEGLLQDRPLFRVGRRRFAIFNGEPSPIRPRWRTAGRSVHFLSDPADRDALLQDPRFTRSPHHGDHGWLAIRLDPETTDWQELGELLEAAYEQVAPRG